jgi:hypothetical protein
MWTHVERQRGILQKMCGHTRNVKGGTKKHVDTCGMSREDTKEHVDTRRMAMENTEKCMDTHGLSRQNRRGRVDTRGTAKEDIKKRVDTHQMSRRIWGMNSEGKKTSETPECRRTRTMSDSTNSGVKKESGE